MCALAKLLILASVATSAALDAGEELPLDMMEDDAACNDVIEGHEQQCALSLRQLRAKRSTEEALETESPLAELVDTTSDNASSGDDANVYSEVWWKEQADYSDVNSSLGAAADQDLGSQYHHHHHHSGGTVKYLYHQTSYAAGTSILRGGFRRGSCGWCGGAIYFATSPQATYGKAKGLDSHHGFMIQAKVNLGRIKYMSPQCTSPSWCRGPIIPTCVDRTFNPSSLFAEGYNSISFSPADGTNSREYVIYSSDRVISMKRYHM